MTYPSFSFPPQNVDDAMTVLPKLATGLDVNVRFTGVSDFEYTPECSVFDLLGIPLYHGWLVDPQVRVGGPKWDSQLKLREKQNFVGLGLGR